MKRYLILLFCLLLAGCASNARLKEVRTFASDAPKLAAFSDLSQRFRDTYQREQPYLSAEAARREEAIDRKRREAYPDFVALHAATTTYMQALGALAGGNAFDYGDQVKQLSSGIKAWPDTGLTDRHVNAYAGLTRLLLRIATSRQQDQAVQHMLRDGQQPLQDALDAMQTLLRYFNKNHDNEERIVLGMLEVQIPYVEAPLLSALARAHQQEKQREYRLLGLRHTLAARHVDEIRTRHAALVQGLDAASAALPAALPDATPPAAGAAPPTTLQGAQP